nr:MAG TPA: hypothetical protein [Caudoviricetes sp.]
MSHNVIVKAFYPLLLTVSCKVGVHIRPSRSSVTLGDILFYNSFQNRKSIGSIPTLYNVLYLL